MYYVPEEKNVYSLHFVFGDNLYPKFYFTCVFEVNGATIRVNPFGIDMKKGNVVSADS